MTANVDLDWYPFDICINGQWIPYTPAVSTSGLLGNGNNQSYPFNNPGPTYVPTGAYTGSGTSIGGGTSGGIYGGNNTWTYATPSAYTYKSMELTRKEMPNAVYIDGMIVTLGIIGSDVECAYIGTHLIFTPGVAEAFDTTTLILDYKDEMYHYNIKPSVIRNKLNTTLLSVTIKK
jgi:hypothetical protein